MPTYEYRCKACDSTWDEFQSITSEPTKKCPECGKRKAERVISAGGGIIFRGSGFYQTDYRSESYKKGAKAEQKSQESTKSDSGSGSTATSTASSSD